MRIEEWGLMTEDWGLSPQSSVINHTKWALVSFVSKVLCTKKRVQCSVRQMCAHQHRLMHMSLYVRICGRKTAKAGSRRPAICPLGEVQTSVQDRLHWREVLGCFLLSPSEAGLQVHCPPAAVSTLWVAPLHSGSTFHRLLFSISFQHSVSTNFYFGSFPWCSFSFHQPNKHLMGSSKLCFRMYTRNISNEIFSQLKKICNPKRKF